MRSKYRPGYQRFRKFRSRSSMGYRVRSLVHHEHKHSGIQFVTPIQRHIGMDKEFLENRKRVYELAKARHPERWTRSTRDWTRTDEVWLNPERTKVETKSKGKAVS